LWILSAENLGSEFFVIPKHWVYTLIKNSNDQDFDILFTQLEELFWKSDVMSIVPLKNSFEPLAFARVADEEKI